MNIRLLQSTEELCLYDQWIKQHPQGTLWQSLEWKMYQEALGRAVRIYAAMNGDAINASALVVIDRTVGGFSTWDCAKGPIGSSDTLVRKITEDATKERCLSLYLSPSDPLTSTNAHHVVRTSGRCEQSPATRIIDLTLSEDDILAQMHQKGRYNIKVARKHGVSVKEGRAADMDAFYALLQSTSKRDSFGIAPKSHYVRFLETLQNSFFLLAMHEEKIVAGLLGVMWNKTGFYYYGASDHARRSLMAPYLLQWEAMKKCKSAGCSEYDLLGIAPPEKVISGQWSVDSDIKASLNSNHLPLTTHHSSSHPWSGISDFKAKFGGRVIEYPPEQEIVLRPIMKGLLKMKRRMLG
ncbi:MAG TPA: peptidoglycan bridge formation glycyltransferase FemA/FemB family protein [Candidatus Peribacteraceae bacterium]|nr:peptidoglycan bridge formation glycyltransferase FemA/FemB family protein [Candidatus Peribacteraceae bacterium]